MKTGEKDYEKLNKMIKFWDEIDNEALFAFSPFGASSLEVPSFYNQNTKNSIEQTKNDIFQPKKYWGSADFCKEVVESFSEIAHLKNLKPDRNIVLGLGATGLIWDIINKFITSDKDECVFFDPSYPYYFYPFEKKGTPVLIPMKLNTVEKKFEYDFELIESKLNQNTKLMIFCNPGNPTSKVISKAECIQLTKVLQRFPWIKIVEDCAYFCYLNEKVEMTYFHEIEDNFSKTFTVFSMGKVFHTTGNRIGFALTEEKLADELKSFVKNRGCPDSFSQKIYQLTLKSALEPYQSFSSFWDFTRHDINHRINYAVSSLKSMGIDCFPVEGTYYLNIDISEISKRVEEKYYYRLDDKTKKEPYRDKAVSRKLLDIKNICLFPFSGIGSPEKPVTDQLIRMVCNRTYQEIDFCLNAIESVMKSGKNDN